MNKYVLIYIFILFILLLFILWFFYPKNIIATNINNNKIIFKGNIINNTCNNIITCSDGLICENNICKTKIGGKCNNLNDCSKEANICENGTCQNIPLNGLNDASPCMNGLSINDNNICKGLPGYICNINNDCLSKSCINNICSNLKSLLDKCNNNSECESGLYCSLGYCQIIGTTTHNLNSICRIPDIPCNIKYNCVNNKCV